MAINREARRQVADSLAAYMRGELTNVQLFDTLPNVGVSSDIILTMAQSAVALENPKAEEHTVSVSQPTWNYLERLLAALESELSFSTISERRVSTTSTLMLVALIAFVACSMVICSRAIENSVWGLALGWSMGGVCPWIVFAICSGLVCSHDDAESSHAPFESNEQWWAHRHLVTRFKLPQYDAAAHHRPVKQRARQRLNLKVYLILALCGLVAPLLLAFFLVQAPIMLAINIFERDVSLRYIAK